MHFISFFLTFAFVVITAMHSSKSLLAIESETRLYLPISEIFPAQLRYASRNVEEKMRKKISKGDAIWNSAENRWEYRHCEGRSIFAMEEAIPVVKSSFGHVLADGHHDVLSSLALKAEWVPVKIIADFSDLTESEFWQTAEAQGLAYLYDTKGERKIPPRDFHLLQDDPNRYFAAITARKCLADGDMQNSIGAEYPLWIKIGKDIPFIEFRIADVLWQHEIVYHYEMCDAPPQEFVEAARRVLVAAKIPGLRVISERQHFTEL